MASASWRVPGSGRPGAVRQVRAQRGEEALEGGGALGQRGSVCLEERRARRRSAEVRVGEDDHGGSGELSPGGEAAGPCRR